MCIRDRFVTQAIVRIVIGPFDRRFFDGEKFILKANELYSTEVNQEYSKDRKEDMVSIFQGIMGQKGNVDINIGNILNFNSDSYEDCSNHITQSIKGLYKLHPTNYAAAIMQGKLNESD